MAAVAFRTVVQWSETLWESVSTSMWFGLHVLQMHEV